MEFQYAAEWVDSDEGRPLSLSLPLTPDNLPNKGKPVETYLDNLLPDSDPIRQRLQTRFHTGSRDAFELLAAIGLDCVGTIQLLPLNETPSHIATIEAKPLTETDIEKSLIKSVSSRAFTSQLD